LELSILSLGTNKRMGNQAVSLFPFFYYFRKIVDCAPNFARLRVKIFSLPISGLSRLDCTLGINEGARWGVRSLLNKSGSGKSQVVELFQPLRCLTVNRFPAPTNLIASVLTVCQPRFTPESSIRHVNRIISQYANAFCQAFIWPVNNI